VLIASEIDYGRKTRYQNRDVGEEGARYWALSGCRALMTLFRLSAEAAQDLIEIYEYIVQDSVEGAERVRIELLEAMLKLT
jgi:hypothetical protein